MTRDIRTVVQCVLTMALALPAPALAQNTDTAVAPPFDLVTIHPGEPSWIATFRLRAAESRYRGTTWWGTYAQLRSQAEARLGNHDGALRFWDQADGGTWPMVVLAPRLRAVPALPLLTSIADTARVIMINERHHAASDRVLTLQLLPVLWRKGFRYLALETLTNTDSGLVRRGYALEQATGYYTDDPVFGEVVRHALRLGYRIVPYECEPSQEDSLDGLTSQQRRDSIEALNLYGRIFRTDPRAKVLVHAGYSHVKKSVTKTWSPMAAYFRKLSGIDPVTVDQTSLSEHSAPEYERPVYREAIAVGLLGAVPIVLIDSAGHSYMPDFPGVDFEVLTPRTTYDHGRPAWMTLAGLRAPTDVPTPECVMRVCVAEVRLATEPDSAVALDRAEVSYMPRVRLFLPRGQQVRVRVTDSAGAVIDSLRPRAGR
jgi:hypothetical protein